MKKILSAVLSVLAAAVLLCGLPCPRGLKERLAKWLDQMTEETQVDVTAAVEEGYKE